MCNSSSSDDADYPHDEDVDVVVEDEDDMCPICFIPLTHESRQNFCVGPCLHRVCRADAERILLTVNKHPPPPHAHPLYRGQGVEQIDPYFYVPTLARCPICRRGWSLFDLQADDNEASADDNGRTTTPQLVCVTNTDMTHWPVTGKTFADQRSGGNGLAISFDLEHGPAVSWYKESDNGPSVEEPQLVIVHFESGSHFHDRSRTFHGHVILLDEEQRATWGGVSSLRCILQFSSNFSFIPLGVWMDEHYKVIEWLGVGRQLLYSVSPEQGRRRFQVRPTYRGSTLWGNTFCQSLNVGLGSHHFLPTEEAYISYEHPLSSQWPPLDNGLPVPDRIFFRNTSYDANERIFRGEICWEDDCGTTWQGFRKWIYQVKYDSKYTYIASGTVLSMLVGTDELHETWTFGNDLVYMNAAVDEYFRTLMMLPGDDNANVQDEQVSDRFTRLSLPLRQQWASEGASVRLTAMLDSVLTKVIMGQESPVDFNLMA